MLLDAYLPQHDAVEKHRIVIEKPQAEVWEALERTDFGRSVLVRWLLKLRGMASGGLPRPLTLAAFPRFRFAILDEKPPDHIVLGLVGRFWTSDGALQRIDRRSFLEDAHEGFARAAWIFELESTEDGTTRLATETRVSASDDRSRQSFLRYWRFVGPFSALIRREMLRQIELETRR